MDPTRALRDEHQVILAVLDCFEIALANARRSGRVATDVFEPFIEFFRGFADRCHHCKEEDRLFPCLERCGMPSEHGPIAVMLHEHRLGRAHVAAMAEALPAADRGDQHAFRTLMAEGTEYLDLLRHHIFKEDHVLFNMAEQMVQGPERTTLLNQYAEAEAESDYRRTLDACRDIADRLCAQYGVNPPPRS